jgi:hypothetical protein
MWRSISSRRVLMSAALVIAACGHGTTPVVALCARGDRDVIAAQVVRLELRFFDASDNQIGAPVELDAHDTHIQPSLPDGAVRVSAIGFDASGAPIAHGDASITNDGGCICFALDAQSIAACKAISCSVVGGSCQFEGSDGSPIGSQTLGFGEAGDVTGVTADTYIQVDQPTTTHDRAVVEAGSNPTRIGLLRFELSAMPPNAIVEDARLVLHVCLTAGCEQSASSPQGRSETPSRRRSRWIR